MELTDLITLLRNAESAEEIDRKRGEIAELIPAVKIMFDYDQKNSYHYEDLWMHSLHVVTGLPADIKDDMLYLAALLHDIGKPAACCRGHREGDTDMHYYGHPVLSVSLIEHDILPGLSLSTEEKRRLLYYVKYHDDSIHGLEWMLEKHRALGFGKRELRNLMLLVLSDARAHVMKPVLKKREEDCLMLLNELA